MICWLCEFKAHRSQKNDRSDSLKWEIKSRSLAVGHTLSLQLTFGVTRVEWLPLGQMATWLKRKCLNLFPSINCAHWYPFIVQSIILHRQPCLEFFEAKPNSNRPPWIQAVSKGPISFKSPNPNLFYIQSLLQAYRHWVFCQWNLINSSNF